MVVTDAELGRVAPAVGRGVRLLADRIADGPAARLGRLGAPDDGAPGREPFVPPGEHPVLSGLRRLGPAGVERVLGALELSVPHLDADLSAFVRPPRDGMRYFVVSGGPEESEALVATSSALAIHDGLGDLALSLSRRLAGHPAVALPVAADGADEQTVAARHGAGHLALGVSVAAALLRGDGEDFRRTAAVVGLGLGTAVVLLREAPMPAAYPAARLARIRAEYLLPRRHDGGVVAAGHRFALAEGDRLPDGGDVAATGLVAAVAGGAVVRTGTADSAVAVEVSVRESAPETVDADWDEVAEVSWRAAEGRASVLGAEGSVPGNLRRVTPPWPGDYRLRVHARGRDPEDGGPESYRLTVWAAPPAPPVLLRATDRLGHRLRGEPVPAVPAHWAYRWIHDSAAQVAATVTVATGVTAEEALRACGADPGDPRPLPREESGTGLLSVLATPEAVLIVEDNHYRGSRPGVLAALSARGRAASMFWNVNAVTRLSFAAHGRVLASLPLPVPAEVPDEVAGALAGLGLTEEAEGRIERALVAVERFTGRGLTRADMDAMAAAGVAYAAADAPEPPDPRPPSERSVRGLGRRLGTVRLDEGRFRIDGAP